MFNVRNIIRNNGTTFYDFETRKSRSQKPRVISICIIALFGAILCPKVSDNLLAGFLAVQSILLGFTINVMFFLLGNFQKEAKGEKSIEAKLRFERLSILYHELFYNVSYFNFIAVTSIISATALLLPTPEVPKFMHDWTVIQPYMRWLNTSPLPSLISATIRGAAMFLFYAMAIEVIFSIARVIGRTSFYFEQRMGQLSSSDIHSNL